jgi:hypothetical protein
VVTVRGAVTFKFALAGADAPHVTTHRPVWVSLFGLVVGCGSGGGQGDGATADTGGAGIVADAGVDAAADGSVTQDTGAGADTASDVAPAVGGITGAIINDSATDFPFPEGIGFQVVVEGAATPTAMAKSEQGVWHFSIDAVPAGAQTLVLTELDGDGNPTWDLFQQQSRRVAVMVPAGDMATAEIHLLAHWESHEIDVGGAIATCKNLRQMAFRTAKDGMAIFSQESGEGGFPDVHGAALVTGDGGLTWTVASKQMVPGPARPSTGQWFGARPLLLYADGKTAVSLPDIGGMVRSEDGGATWAGVGFAPPTWGPGIITYGSLALSDGSLYLSAHTGGAQGSSDRDSISRSTDGGKTWQVLLDRCDRSEADASCSSVNRPTLPMGFAGLDIACGPNQRCVAAGSTSFIHTMDGFATWDTFSALAPNFGCGYGIDSARTYWIPGTMNVWVVAAATGCGAPPNVRRVSSDGGQTFGEWQPSPVSPRGDMQFGTPQIGFDLEVGNTIPMVYLTRDGGLTWKYTGRPPNGVSGTMSGLRLSVVDADHAFVSSIAGYACQDHAFSWLASWRP